MKVVVLYRPNSEYARMTEEFVNEFERRSWGRKVELVSLDTRDGAAMASLYDIISYPAILAIKDDGQLMKNWEGQPFPLFNEVAAYAS